MRLIPMDLSSSGYSTWQPNLSNPFKLSPSSMAIHSPEPHNISDPATNRYNFDIFNFTDDFEIHRVILGWSGAWEQSITLVRTKPSI